MYGSLGSMELFVASLLELYYLSTCKNDSLMATGSIQLSAGHESKCEAAVHVTQKLFSSPEVEAVLLVDVTNAFNSLYQQSATYSTFCAEKRSYQKKEQLSVTLLQCTGTFTTDQFTV